MGPTRINTILQSAFFKLANIIPEEEAIKFMKAAAQKTYGRKGQDVVEKNWKAIDAGAQNVVKVDVPELGPGRRRRVCSPSLPASVRTSLISSSTSRPRSTVRKVTRFLYPLFPL